MKLFIRLLIACITLMVTLNCSLDATSIMVHPQQANPGETITIEFMTFFIRVEQQKTISQNIIRDSVHFGIGLPSNQYSVVSVKAYPASHWRPLATLDSAELAAINSGAGFPQEFYDSIAVFKSREIHISLNLDMAVFFAGRSFDATSDFGPDIQLDADTVYSWNGYSGPLNIQLNRGDPVDLWTANADSSGTTNQDSLGYTMIPVFLTVELKVGTDLLKQNLYYYTKTNSLPPLPDTTNPFGNIDMGSMVYMPFEVVSGTNIQTRDLNPITSQLKVQLTPRKNEFIIRAPLNPKINRPFELGIYNTEGQLVHSPSPFQKKENELVYIWSGNSSAPGMYLAKFQLGEQATSKPIRILK